MNIHLELSDKQAKVLLEALDIYSRLGMGQLDRLDEHPSFINADRCEVERLLLELKEEVFKDLYGLGHSYGIASEKTPETCKIAYDIYQVVRNRIAYFNSPEGGITVNFNEPIQRSKEHLPLCKCNKKS